MAAIGHLKDMGCIFCKMLKLGPNILVPRSKKDMCTILTLTCSVSLPPTVMISLLLSHQHHSYLGSCCCPLEPVHVTAILL